LVGMRWIISSSSFRSCCQSIHHRYD